MTVYQFPTRTKDSEQLSVKETVSLSLDTHLVAKSRIAASCEGKKLDDWLSAETEAFLEAFFEDIPTSVDNRQLSLFHVA